ncbi:capsular polysaccharide synthesis protein [Roseateles sp.]|uniref:glycosyltransferase family 32 protein n=1 Tax=Roseateles sp. TaxID=1971397 RepID=UPI0032656239
MTAAQIGVAGLMALAALLLLRELVTVLRAKVPTQTRAVTVGESAPACSAEIPKIIWTYWQQPPAPAFIRACFDNWRRFAPDHELRLLDRDNVLQWLPALRADFGAMPAQLQSEWLRLQLLARHGGVWMDAATLLSRDLAWLHDTRRRRGADYVGFYLDRFTTRPELPIVDNWLMASVPDGPFVTALAAAFDRALDEGAEALLASLQAQGRHARVVQALPDDSQRYLLMHIAASDLLDREPQAARLVLLRAEDGPYAWQAGVGWSKRRFHARLALLPCPRVLPAMLTLRDGDLAVVERNWRRRLVSPFSALVQFVERRPDGP